MLFSPRASTKPFSPPISSRRREGRHHRRRRRNGGRLPWRWWEEGGIKAVVRLPVPSLQDPDPGVLYLSRNIAGYYLSSFRIPYTFFTPSTVLLRWSTSPAASHQSVCIQFLFHFLSRWVPPPTLSILCVKRQLFPTTRFSSISECAIHQRCNQIPLANLTFTVAFISIHHIVQYNDKVY